jgi:hypothetical protein
MAVARNAAIQFQGGAIKICYFDSMKLVTAFLLSLVLVIISACDCSRKTWDCPGYSSPELDAWFPYSDSILLVFDNGSGSRDTIHLKKTEVSAPYSITARTKNCMATKRFISTENLPSGFKKLSIQLERRDPGFVMHNALISLKTDASTNFEGVTANTLGSARYNYSIPVAIQYFPTVNLSGKNFSNVAQAFRDTTNVKRPGIYKIYIAKNAGIVGYEEFPSRSLFVLQ